MTQTITIHDLPPMLNGKDGLKRMHWARYIKVRDKWVWLIREQRPKKHIGTVAIHFVRYSTRMPDWDNLYSGFKVVGDGLKHCEIIQDDSMKYIKPLTADWEKVSKRKNQRVEIKIEDVG